MQKLFPWGCSGLNKKIAKERERELIRIDLPLTNIGLSMKYGIMPVLKEGLVWLYNKVEREKQKVVFAVGDEAGNLLGLADCKGVDPNLSFKYWLVGRLPCAGIVYVEYFAVGETPLRSLPEANFDLETVTHLLNSTSFRGAIFLQATEHETVLRQNEMQANFSSRNHLNNYFQTHLQNLKELLSLHEH